MNSRGWGIIVGIIAVIAIFQLFLRYSYVKEGYRMMRIDRLSQSSCYMPCTPPPHVTPSPQPTFEDIATTNNEAIAKVQNQPDALYIVSQNPEPRYEWKVEQEYSAGYGVSYSDVAMTYGFAHGKFAKGFVINLAAMPPNAPQFAPPRDPFSSATPTTSPTPYPLHYPIREVCYCNKKGFGWRWEVNLATDNVYRIEGNAELEKRYGITPATPQP